MPLQQLYYTSSTVGLSGFAGWQFNAVSADVSTDLMREVEALTAYQPPQSLMYSDAPEDLARCPVNLCYLPGDPAIAACVRYVGRDDSRRFGNYFAHTLSGADLDARCLPVELWRSPVWQDRPAATTRLPALDAPPGPGPLDAASVGRFVAGHPHGDRLFALIDAVVLALDEGHSVVVVEQDTDAVAHWFAAVCYVLPPALARTVSFATFPKRPQRSRFLLVGSVPEVWREVELDGGETARVFDFAAGRFPPAAPTAAVGLLSRVGLAAARTFWSWAAEYATGREATLADWYSPAVAAAASGGTAMEPADITALLGWLDRSAAHLDPAVRAAVARDAYRLRPLSAAQLAVIGRTAGEGGDAELAERIQSDLMEDGLRRYMADDPDAAAPRPFADPERRRRATALWLGVFTSAELVPAARLLRWASAGGLRPDPDALLRKCTLMAQELLGGTVTARTDDALVALLRAVAGDWPEFRRGMVAALRELFTARPSGFPQLMHGLPSEVLDEADLVDTPELREAYLLARAERRPGEETSYLFRILAVRGAGRPLDGDLLKRLWPRGRWTHGDALAVARQFDPDLPLAPGAGHWFDAAVRREPEPPGDMDAMLALAQALLTPRRRQWLDQDSRACAAAVHALAESLREARSSDDIMSAVAALPATPPTWRSYQALLDDWLPKVLAARPADPRHIAVLFGRMTPRAAELYLRRERKMLCGDVTSPDPVRHVLGLLFASMGATQSHREGIGAIVRAAVDDLTLGQVERIAEHARAERLYGAGWLQDVVDKRRMTVGRKVSSKVRGLFGKGAPDASAPAGDRTGKAARPDHQARPDRPAEPRQPKDKRRKKDGR